MSTYHNSSIVIHIKEEADYFDQIINTEFVCTLMRFMM